MSQISHHGITINPSRDNLFDELGIARLKESYMLDSELSPQERFAFVSKTFSSNSEHAQRLYEYSSSIGYLIPPLSYLTDVLSGVFLSPVILITLKTPQKV